MSMIALRVFEMMGYGLIMLSPIRVFIADYNPEWPVHATEYAAELRAISPIILNVYHIGSTAVPGLAAKPIIDLMLLVTNLTALDELRSRTEALGYKWHGELGISGRRYCTLSNEAGIRIVQLHCFEEGSPHIERHLAFRDYLRTYPDVAEAYENEKRRAAQLHSDNSHAYSDEKGEWIRNIESEALAWYRKHN
jgi:GrpB-like predicted nucleotidyltransferase (UPF0157 family)